MWRWDGQRWISNVPMQVRQAGGGGGGTAAVVIAILAVPAILVLVSVIVIVVLLTMGNQIANVFSNVVAALGTSPSP
jgi:hypothetical protein